MQIIDSHIHSGTINVGYNYEKIKLLIDNTKITHSCIMPPVEDVYNRYNKNFTDNEYWQTIRKKANNYVLNLSKKQPVYPIFFVWNDFNIEQLKQGFLCVKWHRHENEPEYNYESEKCGQFLKYVCKNRLPILLEETFKNTKYLINRISGKTNVIIPHLGALNGGFEKLFQEGLWDKENVYADSALASINDMETFLKKYSSKKLLFGSDYPFSTPAKELNKIEELKLTGKDLNNVLSNNVKRLYNLITY